eukprot:tig00021569_g22340.t1
MPPKKTRRAKRARVEEPEATSEPETEPRRSSERLSRGDTSAAGELVVAQEEGDSLEHGAAYRKRLASILERVRSGALAGCREISLDGCAIGGYGSGEWTKEDIDASLLAASDVAELLALAAKAGPLEHVHFGAGWWRWPREEEQREKGVAEPLPLKAVARSFLAALAGARLSTLSFEDPTASPQKQTEYEDEEDDDEHLCRAVIDAAAPGCFPHISELRVGHTYGCRLRSPQAAKLAKVWPSLKKLSCGVLGGGALEKLARLRALEELRVTAWFDDDDESSEGLLEAALGKLGRRAPSARALHLLSSEELRVNLFDLEGGGDRVPDLVGCGPRPFLVGPDCLKALLRLSHLEELSLGVEDSSSGLLPRLASLQKLRTLKLDLPKQTARNGGKALFEGAAKGLRALPALRLQLLVDNYDEHCAFSINSAGLARLVRDARPILDELIFNHLNLGEDSASSLFREVARGGPRLRRVMVVSELDGGLHRYRPLLRLSKLYGATPAMASKGKREEDEENEADEEEEEEEDEEGDEEEEEDDDTEEGEEEEEEGEEGEEEEEEEEDRYSIEEEECSSEKEGAEKARPLPDFRLHFVFYTDNPESTCRRVRRWARAERVPMLLTVNNKNRKLEGNSGVSG